MKKSLDNMSQNDYLEKVSKMTKDELSDVLLNEQNHNSAFIEMVKDEYAYRVLNEESNEISRNDVTPHNSQPEIVKDDRNKNEIKSNIPIFLAIVVAYILLSGLNNLRHMNVPYSILCIYSVYLLVKRRGNAVFVALGTFLISVFDTILFLLSDPAHALLPFLIRVPIIAACICYLIDSKDMEEYLPKSKRFHETTDYIFIGAVAVLYIIIGLLPRS